MKAKFEIECDSSNNLDVQRMGRAMCAQKAFRSLALIREVALGKFWDKSSGKFSREQEAFLEAFIDEINTIIDEVGISADELFL